MERVSVDDVPPDVAEGDADRRSLTGPLGASHVAINHIRLAPDERASGLHTHLDQEELFVVLDGRATFETLADEVVVEAAEAVRFAAGEYHSGAIAEGAPVAVLALGAPEASEEIRIPLSCPECGHDARRPGLAADEVPVLVCPECDTEADATCPDCGSADVQAVLADDGAPVGVCRDCGEVSEE